MENEKMKKFMNSQIDEIQKHKWIESEKANQDLGEEAIKDWIIKYAKQFRKEWEEKKTKVKNKENRPFRSVF